MTPATIPLPCLLLLLLARPGVAVDLINASWTGIDAASVVVVGNGVVAYDPDLIRNRIEVELTKAGMICLDPDLPSPGMPRVTIVAHVDGMPIHRGDGTSSGCVYHWSLSASCWATQVVGGSGTVILEEHHDIGFGPANVLPHDCINGFSLLAMHMAANWLRDNPQ